MENDWALTASYDYDRFEKWFTLRLEFENGVCIKADSASPGLRIPPKVIAEKLALLKVSPVGAKVADVGWRRTEDIFYLRIYESDLPLGERYD